MHIICGCLKNNILKQKYFQFQSLKMFLRKCLNITTENKDKENTRKVKRRGKRDETGIYIGLV